MRRCNVLLKCELSLFPERPHLTLCQTQGKGRVCLPQQSPDSNQGVFLLKANQTAADPEHTCTNWKRPIYAFVFHDPPSPCILGTHHEKGAQTFWSVVNRLPLSSNAVLCWKFCHVFHKLLRDGHPNVSSWGCRGWPGSQGPMWGRWDRLGQRECYPLLHRGGQLPPSPGLLVTG